MTAQSKPASSPSGGGLSPRILELREKIQNPEYLDFAVQRIAQVLSRRIVEDAEQRPGRGGYESN